MIGFKAKVILLGMLCFIVAPLGAQSITQSDFSKLHSSTADSGYEPSLLKVINFIEARDLSSALVLVDKHLLAYPESREAHFLRADILQAQSGSLANIGGNELISAKELANFKHQLKNRLKHTGHAADIAHTHYPSNLIAIGQHKHIIVADMANGRLYLYQNKQGQPTLIRDYYMSIGSEGFGKEVEGDNRTPVGIYEINRYIEGKALPDLYGKGAFPVNYPNRYDRFLKRTGYGIWLHGTPSSTYARSPWSSEGCFVLSNDDLLDIGQYLSVEERTPVILSDSIEWLSADELQAKKEAYLAIFSKWKRDWENLDVLAYLSHYENEDFNFGNGDYKSWSQRKHRLNAKKTFVQLDFTLHSLFVYPGDKDMFVIKYRQRYLSNNYSGETDKEQYWQRNEDGEWKIIYEG